ncbi:MAG: DUF3553 domain-containing protein [Beijerinckiaceae bacterium]
MHGNIGDLRRAFARFEASLPGGWELRVGDRVAHLERPDWNIGTVQSISDETGIVTCYWPADHAAFQFGCSPKKLHRIPALTAPPASAGEGK